MNSKYSPFAVAKDRDKSGINQRAFPRRQKSGVRLGRAAKVVVEDGMSQVPSESQEEKDDRSRDEPDKSPAPDIMRYHTKLRAQAEEFWQKNVHEVQRLIDQKKLDSAENIGLRLLEVSEEFERDDKRLGITLELLSQIYYRKCEYHYGAPVLMRLLQMYRRCLGPDHLDTGTITHNAAILYQAWKKYNEAGIFYQQSMYIKSSKLGYEHPDVALIRNNYARYLREISQLKGKTTEQRPAYTPLAQEKLSDRMGAQGETFTKSGQFDTLPPEVLEAPGAGVTHGIKAENAKAEGEKSR